MPRYRDFLPDVESIGMGVVASSLDEQQPKLEENLMKLAERPKFHERFKTMTNDGFVDALAANARIILTPAERAAFIDKLNNLEQLIAFLEWTLGVRRSMFDMTKFLRGLYDY
jgi:hypothetical protein